jgi:hypothetical protein
MPGQGVWLLLIPNTYKKEGKKGRRKGKKGGRKKLPLGALLESDVMNSLLKKIHSSLR